MTSKPTGPAIPLPFVRDFRTPRGGPRRNFWAVKPTGDEIKDRRLGRKAALAYMAWEAERFASDPEHESIINLIVDEIIQSGDSSAVVTGFFATLAGCSVGCWRPEEVDRFRQHYEQADKEFDEQLAALSRRYARVTLQKSAA